MDEHELGVETQPGNGYAFSGTIMLTAAIGTLFAFVVFLVGLHLYARRYLRRLRRRNAARTHIVIFANNRHPTDHGLEAAVLNSLPVFPYSSSKAAEADQPPLECAVCLTDFEENDAVRLLPKCNHSFHIECIDMWFHSHSTCPLCRSAVDPAVNRNEPPPVVVVVEANEEASGSEPGSSSGSGMCATCQHEEEIGNVNDNNTAPLARRRKAMGVVIEVAPPRRAELENELTQSSPGVGRLLSFKRLLSMGRKSPAGGATPRYKAESSRGAAELDLEGGVSEPVRVYTPR
ncbi:hypothetical protein DH2020_020054 [Rehmannia glutinosa]|uniref:RING-type domain-containing protein n=1 Tax=Rehmannia glutinosa TaxID=99300 RepID=A0ABR0WJ60_REHGL